MRFSGSCALSTGQIFDVAINVIGLVLNVILIILEVLWPSFSGSFLGILIVGHVAWILSAILMILAICIERFFLVYIAIVVQLGSLVAFTLFVTFSPYIYLIVVLIVAFIWWIITVSSVIIWKIQHRRYVV